ncbi:inhibitor of Bruton tyrosine kinase [Achroia grisella]|uniref:inhibitor of Bruton tyrosine kinase n=1 Tax=Achroia grisella TaxID=688607 RepID=UPI0027D270E6|nr:inhibitor of Bruton tyrosine kinase [Achroia grisella]
MSKNKIDVDCTRRCRSRNHGEMLTSAITKRSKSDQSLACFIKATCANFVKAFDFEGRTALHMSASRGRCRLMDWLIRHSSEAFVNARDRESGYTPLHRSVFYGQIHSAISLMKIGVNIDIVDKDDYKALEHATLDRQYMYKHEGHQPSEVYVWGSNSNYTLGTGTQQQRNTPEMLGCFGRNNTLVKQVCLGKFHSVWVCEGADGTEVWSCGQLGRAGGPHSTALQPVQLRLPEACMQAAVMLNSTVFLLENGCIVQYTLNNDNISQSSTKSSSSIRVPGVKSLMKLSKPRGVCTSRWHGVFWNEHAVYTWGTNVGQLGHSQTDKVVHTPKRVAVSVNNKEGADIMLAGAADAATVITTSRGDVYLLHKHICKKIAIKQINLRQVCVDAKISEQGIYSRVTVLLLTNVGQLLLWQDTTNKLTRCVFGLNHQSFITHVTLTHDAVYFTTKYGEAFVGNISRKTPPITSPEPIIKDKEKDAGKSMLVKFLEKDDCTTVRITKIPNIHRAVSIAVDSEGQNFACLQIKPTCGLTSLPELSPSSLAKQMETLLETASDDDLLHDVTFKVGTRYYPAHMFIVASGSEHLYKLYQEKLTSPEDKPVILLDNVLPEVFDRILRYMYTGTCDVAELGPCSLKIRREDLNIIMKREKSIDLELEVIENESELSAFEVYQEHNKTKKGNRKSRTSETPPRNLYCDPVKLVQASARRLQVIGLYKLLDKFYYKDGTVHLKVDATYSRPTALSWQRAELPLLTDTVVCSRTGQPIAAHRCILAARLDYFHGMFMHSWSESKLLSQVSLPINDAVLLPVIDFLYTDTCPEIMNSDSIDFICSMLIVADQFLITRLREMCEIALANLITLKNCSELCQFAHTYNATQLKQSCMEFISLNLCNILENRVLEHLEDTLLEDITNYYCKFNPIMASRVITPFFNAPSDEIIDDCEVNFPIDLEVTDDDLKRDDSIVEVSKKKRQSKKIEYTDSEKARMRYESVSSVTSLDLSNEISGDITLSLSNISKETEKGARDKKEKWIEVPSSQQKQQKVIQARLKAINSARDILNETPTESFTKLTKTNSSNSININNIQDVPTSSRISVSPKDSPLTELSRSPQGNLVISHVGPKMSQKQRKKLAIQGIVQSPQNLDDYVNKLNISSPPEKPKNPWKICELPVASSSPNKKTIEFNQILTDQKKQREDFSRIMTKPLTLTQLEDKAIEELERFYNVHEVDDELITVRRIELHVSTPQWIHTAPK